MLVTMSLSAFPFPFSFSTISSTSSFLPTSSSVLISLAGLWSDTTAAELDSVPPGPYKNYQHTHLLCYARTTFNKQIHGVCNGQKQWLIDDREPSGIAMIAIMLDVYTVTIFKSDNQSSTSFRYSAWATDVETESGCRVGRMVTMAMSDEMNLLWLASIVLSSFQLGQLNL